MQEIKLIEIYSGKDPEWAGWHNVIITNGNKKEDICLCGPLNPQRSERLKNALQKK